VSVDVVCDLFIESSSVKLFLGPLTSYGFIFIYSNEFLWIMVTSLYEGFEFIDPPFRSGWAVHAGLYQCSLACVSPFEFMLVYKFYLAYFLYIPILEKAAVLHVATSLFSPLSFSD
jgi:hypothetical protein